MGAIHKYARSENGEGGLSKSVHPLFWRRHSFVKNEYKGEGGIKYLTYLVYVLYGWPHGQMDKVLFQEENNILA